MDGDKTIGVLKGSLGSNPRNEHVPVIDGEEYVQKQWKLRPEIQKKKFFSAPVVLVMPLIKSKRFA